MSAIQLTSASLSVHLNKYSCDWRMQPDCILRCSRRVETKLIALDGWSVRAAFLSLKPCHAPDALEFLERTGAFSRQTLEKRKGSMPISLEEFYQIQSMIALLLKTDPLDWTEKIAGYSRKLQYLFRVDRLPEFVLNWKAEVPTAGLMTNFTFSAMLTTVQIDKWRQARFRSCAKPGCQVVFEIEGGRFNKIYCDDRCAQHQALRAYRKRKALAAKDQS